VTAGENTGSESRRRMETAEDKWREDENTKRKKGL